MKLYLHDKILLTTETVICVQYKLIETFPYVYNIHTTQHNITQYNEKHVSNWACSKCEE